MSTSTRKLLGIVGALALALVASPFARDKMPPEVASALAALIGYGLHMLNAAAPALPKGDA